MASTAQETLIPVPAELVRQCVGLTIDMGSSLIKFVYRGEEDGDKNGALTNEKPNGLCHLHLVSFTRQQLDEALDYVRERADIRRSGDEPMPTVHTTGVGCTQFGKNICDKLNVKLVQLTEFDCFPNAFIYLATRLSRTQLLHPFIEDAVTEPVTRVKAQLAARNRACQGGQSRAFHFDFAAMIESISQHIGGPSVAALERAELPLLEAEPDMFPCMLAVCGSAAGFIKIEKDCKYRMVDMCYRNGRTFVGIGSLLTGSKTFDELVELAANGDPRNVDQYSDDVIVSTNVSDGDDSAYKMYSETVKRAPLLLFSFGKAVGSTTDAFRREDLARAWLNHVVLDVVQCAHNASSRHGVRRMFFCGSFCNSPLVRYIITTEMVRRNVSQLALCQSEGIHFDFIKPGSHLGALGCVINDVEKFI
jgi:pantothenate kinase